MHRPALFCDRDGTIIRDAHYLRDPALVELLPGATTMLRAFAEAGYALVVVTNQSGIARGLLSEADYQAVRARLDAELATDGVHLDASMHCPHEPSVTGPCRCRKPGTLLYEQAAAALHLDVTRSVYVGDRWRDIAPALALGGRGILVPGPDTPADDVMRAREEAEVVPSLADLTRMVLG